MSSYSSKLSREIRFFQTSILRNKYQIAILQKELRTGENVFNQQTHKNRIKILTLSNTKLRTRLSKTKELVF